MYRKNAFGNPDGSRTSIDDMMAQFVDFDERFFASGVATNDDLKTRVIVGAKGSGKTVYLRRMRAKLKQNDSVYICEIEQEVPATDLIIKFSQNFSENHVTEKWMYLWKFAIIRALISNILCNNEWNEGVSDEFRKRLLLYQEKQFLPSYSVPMGIYAEARRILTEYNTANLFNNFINNPLWDELDILISKILKDLPPIYFFIDSVDEEYAHAPMYWMRCQKGLFYRVMRLFRNETYGNKLHVVISIRDNVLASVYRSEHQTRYINEEHIKQLNWDYSAIKYFLDTKISSLKECYFINELGNKNLQTWLGISHIFNINRDIEEPLEQYILRHTRLLPRDIIIIGNSLAEIRNMKENNPDFDLERIIRKKVSIAAKGFGNELLQICANQIINNDMPKGAAQKEYSEVYTSIKEYNSSVTEKIKNILLEIESDKFSYEKLCELENKAKSVLGENERMFDILWQNGALGYLETGANGEEEIFFTDSEYMEFLLPKNKKVYVLRSCIIDALGMNNAKWDKKPVLGFG